MKVVWCLLMRKYRMLLEQLRREVEKSFVITRIAIQLTNLSLKLAV